MGYGFESPLEQRDQDELEWHVQVRKKQLQDYDETVLTEQVREFEELLLHVNDNWEDYSMDLYHGTQEAAVEDILDTGYLLPSEKTEASTGEIPDKDFVSFSTSRPIAAFYAEHAAPTPEQAQGFVEEHLPSLTGSDCVPDVRRERGRGRFCRLIDHYLEGRDNLGEVEKHLYNLSDRLDDLGDLGDPAVIGLDEEHLHNPRGDIGSVENELINEEKEAHLAEVQCDMASVEGGMIYVRDDKMEGYREMVRNSPIDMTVRSLHGLKLRHELEMWEDYSHSGLIDIRSVWDTSRESRPGLHWEERESGYDNRPHVVDISG
jgi:hypothetical protein